MYLRILKSVCYLSAFSCLSSRLFAQSTPALQDASFQPLRDPFPVPLLPDYVWWILIAGGTLLTIFIFLVIINSRKNTQLDSEKINPLNLALEALKKLEGNLSDLDAGQFSTTVSEIVRRYIEQACSIPAQEQTTEEFLQSIQSNPYFTEEIREPLAYFLGLCDMAKFAQQSVDLEQRKTLLTEAGQLVEKLYRFVVKRSKDTAFNPPSLTSRPA